MKKIIAITLLFLCVMSVFAENVFQVPVIKTYWSVQHNAYIIIYQTMDGQNKQIILGQNNTQKPSARIDLIEKNDEWVKVKGIVSPDNPTYRCRWELISQNGVKQYKGNFREVNFDNLSAEKYTLNLIVLDRFNVKVATASRTVELSDPEIGINISQVSLVNYKHYSTQVKAAIDINPERVQSYKFQKDNDQPEESKENHKVYSLEPEVEYTFTVSALLANGKIITSQKQYKTPGLPVPTIGFSYTQIIDTEENSSEVNLRVSTNRTDLIKQENVKWTVNGESKEAFVKLNPGSYNIAVISGENIRKEERITITKPSLNRLSHTMGSGYNADNQKSVTFHLPSFSAYNIKNVEKGSFVISNKLSGDTYTPGKQYLFDPGVYDITTEFFNSAKTLINSRTDRITVDNPPLHARFETIFTGALEPSKTQEWKGVFPNQPGKTILITPVSDTLHGNIEWDITITLEKMEVILKGTMSSDEHTAVITQGYLSGDVAHNARENTLSVILKGDVYITFSGGSVNGKTVKIPLQQNLNFAIKGDDGELEIINIGLSGEGKEHSGNIQPIPSPQTEEKEIEEKPANQNTNQGGRNRIVKPVETRPEPKPILLNINGVDAWLEIIPVSKASDQWLAFRYMDDHSIKKIHFYFHEPSLTYIFPGRISISKEELAPKVISVFK